MIGSQKELPLIDLPPSGPVIENSRPIVKAAPKRSFIKLYAGGRIKLGPTALQGSLDKGSLGCQTSRRLIIKPAFSLIKVFSKASFITNGSFGSIGKMVLRMVETLMEKSME